MPLSFFRRKTRPQQPSTAAVLSESGFADEPLLFNGQPIPVYPDRGPPVPAVPPDRLLASQAEQLRKLHHDSALSHEEFHNFIMPAVRNYAAYVHLLPASEVNHHCGQGGLLRHGLEVATNAARLCNNRKFAMDQVPSLRHHIEPRWRACALIGGMLHDMGKPLIDVGAVDDSGQLVWAPHSKSLWEWLCEHRLTGYRIQWRAGARYKRHEALNAIPTYRIIPDATMSWLLQYGSEPMDQLVLMLAGNTDPRNPYSQLIKQADSQSVSKDLKAQHIHLASTASTFNRSLAARLFRAMHDLLEGGQWIPNRPGSPIWLTSEGIVGLYPAVFQDALDVLRSEDFSPLPTDYASLLELFSDWGYITPNQLPNGSTTFTWNVAIETEERGRAVQVRSQVIRFSRNEIYPGTLPQPVIAPCWILDIDGNPISHGTVSPPARPARDALAEDSEAEASTTSAAPAGEPLEFAAPSPSHEDSELRPNGHVETVPVPEDDRRPPEEAPLRDRSLESDPRVATIDNARANYDAEFPPVDAVSASRWLHDAMQEPHGPILFKIAERVRNKRLRPGLDVVELDGIIHLATPAAFNDLGLEPPSARASLEGAGWTTSDSRSRTTVDLNIQGKKAPYARLTPDLSVTFLRLMEGQRIVLTQREGRKDRPVAWGPHLREAEAAFLLANEGNQEACAIILKKALFDFVANLLREDTRPMYALTADDTRSLVLQFLKTHPGIKSRFRGSVLRELWSSDPNALICPHPDAPRVNETGVVLNDGFGHAPHIFNPKFDPDSLNRSHKKLLSGA